MSDIPRINVDEWERRREVDASWRHIGWLLLSIFAPYIALFIIWSVWG